jgi:hypothetical protein
MNSDFYKKLVDLYAGHDLPAELEDQLELAAADDQELSRDMLTIRHTVEMLHKEPQPEFTEESYQRVLLKLYTRGVALQTTTPDPAHLQYHLPMQG